MRKGHGFSTRDEWSQAFDSYYTEIKLMNTMSYHLLNKSGPFAVWMSEYRGQSRVVQSMFQTKGSFVQNHIQYFIDHPKEFTPQIQNSLLDYLFRYCMRMEDSEAIYMASNLLMKEAIKKNDEIMIMKCCYIYAVIYSFLDVHDFTKMCVEYLNLGISLYEQQYSELDEETKSLGLSFYDQLNSIFNDTMRVEKNFSEYFEKTIRTNLEKALKTIARFWKNCDQKAEVNTIIPAVAHNMICEFLKMCFRIPANSINSTQVAYIKKLTKHEYGLAIRPHDEIEQGRAILFQMMAVRFDQGFDREACLLKIDELTNQALLREGQKEIKADEVEEIDYFAQLSTAFQTVVNEDENTFIKELGIKILGLLLNRIAQFSHDKYLQHVADEASFLDVIPLVRYLHTEEQMIDTVLNLTIYRQLQTAIHTKMVAHAAKLIVQSLLERKPEYFVHTFHCETKKEVEEHKEEIIQYIVRGAMLHDVGKILCTNIINMQYRKITGIEFETIKFHPHTSGKIIQQIPKLNKYYDMAVGHHKYFDGSRGYPNDFDNVHSPDKKFIDIITIADSLDAASDPFGRNYAEAKSLPVIMKEFEAQKGTRYSDVIVDFLACDREVYNAINHLLTKGRIQVNEEVYEILQQNLRIRKTKHSTQERG